MNPALPLLNPINQTLNLLKADVVPKLPKNVTTQKLHTFATVFLRPSIITDTMVVTLVCLGGGLAPAVGSTQAWIPHTWIAFYMHMYKSSINDRK